MKGLQAIVGAFYLLIIGAQLVDLKLSKRVIQICRIVGAASRLFIRVRGFLKCLLLEKLCALLDGPALSVQLDSDNVTRVAKEGLFELGQAHSWIAASETFFDHHLLGVMRPAFDVA